MTFAVEQIAVLPDTGMGVLLIEPDRSPPHLAVLLDGIVYSASVKGISLRNSSKWQQLLLQKQIPWVLFKVDGIKNLAAETVLHVFNECVKIGESETCLKPLKIIFKGMGFDVLHCKTWPDVHRQLSQNGIHFQVLSTDGRIQYVFPKYSHQDVLKYIRSIT